MSYNISNAKYAKGQKIVHVARDGLGCASREDRLLRALNARWTHRERGYVLSASKAARFEKLVTEGWDADLRFDGIYKTHYELVAPTSAS